jgi:hypothetical protein
MDIRADPSASPLFRSFKSSNAHQITHSNCKILLFENLHTNYTQDEVRQTSATEDWHPDPSKSLPLDKARQALLNDIIALYSCEPTIERVKRYTPDCVYDDQFVYANDRYKLSKKVFRTLLTNSQL